MKYFSPTSGFLDSRIHSQIPGDAVEVADDEYARLLSGQAQGKVITINAAGRAELTENSAAPDRRLLILAELDKIDAASLRPLRALYAGTGTDADKARVAELEAAASALRDELQTLN